jgi:SAM-dependent methyltransferase
MRNSDFYRWQQFVSRKSQEMMWDSFRQGFAPIEQSVAERLAAPNAEGAKGRLEIDPEFKAPEWFTETEIHIQPGGYHSYALAGIMAEWASKLYHLRSTLANPIHTQIANIPTIENPERCLDLGTGVGGVAVELKRRYPSADVWGVDIGEPLLRYAHVRAEDLGVGVTFSLQDTADLRFPDNTFDVITSHIIFHEMPVDVIKATIREAYRVLKPGGQVALADLPPYRVVPAYNEWVMRWQVENNGEPFWSSFLELDMLAEFEAAGFRNIKEQGNPRNPGMPYPWIYTAEK